MESQEGGGGHGHKFKGKEGSRQSASHKAAAGYKVEDKTTWTLLQQQQQYFTPPPPVFTPTHLLHPFRHPLPTFFTFSDFYIVVGSLAAATLQTDGMSGTESHFFFLIFASTVWLPAPPCTWLSNKNIVKEQFTCFCFSALWYLGFRRVKNKVHFFPPLLECLINTSCWSWLVIKTKGHFQDKYVDIFGC